MKYCFGGLALGCVEADFCKLLGKHSLYIIFPALQELYICCCRYPWFLQFSAAPLRRAGRLLLLCLRRVDDQACFFAQVDFYVFVRTSNICTVFRRDFLRDFSGFFQPSSRLFGSHQLLPRVTLRNLANISSTCVVICHILTIFYSL